MKRRPMALMCGLGAAVTALSASALIAAPSVSAATGSPAVKPPLGWNSWNTFGCNITEAKIRAAADAMVTSGMQAAGYRYVVVDDCWQASTRDNAGNLRADPTRFPSGMKALGDYVHGKGLKFGIYQAPREKTCAQLFNGLLGATGALGHETQDANTFASWGVDYLKYDWCSSWGTLNDQIAGFTRMRDALRATGRPIVYSINPNSAHSNTGPAYNWGSIADMWRTTEDVTDRWTTGCTGDCAMGVTEILDVQAPLFAWAGPQHWNDPDMLEVGVRGTFTPIENRAHFGMWAIMAAPLIAGNDITTMPADVLRVLTDPDVLAIDQDAAGRQARRVRDDGSTEIWARTLDDGSVAVALLNRSAGTTTASTTASEIGMAGASSYNLFDLWTKTSRNTSGAISATVPPHGVVMYRARSGSGASTDSFSLLGAGSGRCLDLLGGAANDAVPAVIWDCNGGPTQIVTAVSGQLRIGGKCLDAEANGTGNGTAVIVWGCGGGTNQQWTMQSDGTIRGVQSGKCIDVTEAATANNTKLLLWTCSAAANQRWARV